MSWTTKQHSEAVLGLGSGGKVIGGDVTGIEVGLLGESGVTIEITGRDIGAEDGGVTLGIGTTGVVLPGGIDATDGGMEGLWTGCVGTDTSVEDGKGTEGIIDGGTTGVVDGNGEDD